LSIFSADERTALAKLLFPQEWERCAQEFNAWGRKRRKHLRELAVRNILTAALKIEGHSCRTCSAYSGGVCALHTDFYGTVKVNPNTVSTCHSALDNYRNRS